MTASSTCALSDRLAAGDSEALMRLFDRYAGFVNALVLRILPDADSADEVVAAVFLQAWREANTRTTQVGTLVWLCATARARAINRLPSWERTQVIRSRRVRETVSDLAVVAPGTRAVDRGGPRTRSSGQDPPRPLRKLRTTPPARTPGPSRRRLSKIDDP